MKLEDIQELWHKDREIDYTELGTESIRIPLIHDKYLKIFTDERIRLKGVEFELSKLVRAKTEYYSGKMSQEELERRGWEQYLGRLLKNEIANYIESDDDVSLYLSEREASFVVKNVRMTTRLIDGEFPDYQRLVPDSNPNKLTANRGELFDAVRRVRLLAQEATPVRLEMSNNGLELIAKTQDIGEAHEIVDATYSGDELIIAFNAEYLLKGLEIAPGEEVTLETTDNQKPAVLRAPEHPEFLYLLMPVRIS